MVKNIVRSFLYSILLFTVILISPAAGAATQEASEILQRLESKQNKSFTLPDFEKGKIKNGFKYYYISDYELPIVKFVIYMKGGSVYDPSGKSGLADIYTALLRDGGTEKMTPGEVDEFLDRIASSINIGSENEYISAAVTCRAENFDKTMDLLLDMLFKPRFDVKRFELLKKQYKNVIMRRPDDPQALASTGFSSLLYGRENPWGAYQTVKSIGAISLEDVRDYHKRFSHPENMIIGLAGAVKKGEMTGLLKKYDGYPPEKGPEITSPPADPAGAPGIHIIDKESNQVVFNVGHAGGVRQSPDKYALILMNDILAGTGSFKTRLPELIRVERGLAYTVWSYFGFGPENAPGIFKIFLATKNESSAEALQIVIDELKRFSTGEDIRQDELDRSKKAILERLIFEYGTTFDIMNGVVRFNYFGYPDNYVEVYGKSIEKVSLDDVKRVAKKYLHPERLEVVLVGEGKEIEKLLNKDYNFNYITIEN